MERDYKNIEHSPWALERPDTWCGMYIGPTGVPNTYGVHGYVCRGMDDEKAAREYAHQAADFFARNGLDKTVFVVRGPTSTSRRSAFEVTDACSSYTVVAKIRKEPPPREAGPQPGMLLRTAIATYGLEALRGVPIDVGTGEPIYISNRCLDGDIALWSDTPSEAFRISRFYGGDTPEAPMVSWIYVGVARIAAAAPQELEVETQAVERERG